MFENIYFFFMFLEDFLAGAHCGVLHLFWGGYLIITLK